MSARSLHTFLSLLVFVLVSFTYSASAQKTWVAGTNGNWEDDANWSGGTAPTSTDDVLLSVSLEFRYHRC